MPKYKVVSVEARKPYSSEGEEGGVVCMLVLHTDSLDAALELCALFVKEGDKGGSAAKTPVAEVEEEAPAKPKKTTKKVTKKAEPEPEEEEEEEDGVEEEEEDDDEEEAEEEEAEEEEEEEPAPKSKKISITAEDLKTLKAAKKIREVLQYLIEKKGIRSRKALVTACKAIQAKVPALARIEDLEDRVPNAVELLDPTIK